VVTPTARSARVRQAASASQAPMPSVASATRERGGPTIALTCPCQAEAASGVNRSRPHRPVRRRRSAAALRAVWGRLASHALSESRTATARAAPTHAHADPGAWVSASRGGHEKPVGLAAGHTTR